MRTGRWKVLFNCVFLSQYFCLLLANQYQEFTCEYFHQNNEYRTQTHVTGTYKCLAMAACCKQLLDARHIATVPNRHAMPPQTDMQCPVVLAFARDPLMDDVRKHCSKRHTKPFTLILCTYSFILHDINVPCIHTSWQSIYAYDSIVCLKVHCLSIQMFQT